MLFLVSVQKVTLGLSLLQKPSEKTVKPEEKMEEDDLEENEIDFSTSRVDSGKILWSKSYLTISYCIDISLLKFAVTIFLLAHMIPIFYIIQY